MAITDPRDTLAFHLSRPVTLQRDFSKTRLKSVTTAIHSYQHGGNHGTRVPEAEALAFYGMNHGMALLQQEYAPLEPLQSHDLEFVEAYHEAMAPMAVRAFNYLMLICTREARHLQNLDKMASKVQAINPNIATFLQSISGGEAGIHQALLATPPDCTVGEYVDALRMCFYEGKWSGGFGGPAWGAVNDCLCRFVHGEFTAEMMLDTNWTLAHNNGPIFNKGLFYDMYNGPALKRILDVQRGGQIPEMVLFDKVGKQYATTETKGWMAWLDSRFSGKIGKYVDWYAVEALGAMQSYPSDKEAQLAAHGMSPLATALEKKKAEEAAAKIAAEKAAAELYEKTHFTVMPGVVIDKVQVREAA